jgi:serralysin
MEENSLDLHPEDDLPVRDDLRYLSPTETGTAYNGKDIATLEEAAANLNRTGAIWSVGPNGQITYTFLDKDPTGLYNSPKYRDIVGDYTAGFTAFTEAQREATRDSLQLWDDLIAPTFVEKNGAGAADISFMNTNTGPGQAAAFTPFYQGGHGRDARIQGDVYVNQDQADNFDLHYGGYGQTTLVHEIGHAIGLSHIGDYNASDDNNGDGIPDPITYAGDAYIFQDSYQYSIMSYFTHGNTGARGYVNWETGGYYQTPQTPMVHDIAAVQAMYGADLTTRTGDTTYGFNSTADRAVFDFTINKNPFLTIYDAGGHDTLDLSGFTVNSILDLNDGAFSSAYTNGNAAVLNEVWGTNFTQAQWNAIYAGQTSNPGFLSENIGIAYGTDIEDGITGSGNDQLFGNELGNVLNGGAGNDRFTGGAGSDTFVIGEKGFTDTIIDFKSGQDRLDLSAFGIDASDLTFNGKTVFADVDGNGAADLAIVSQGDNILVSDIIFG